MSLTASVLGLHPYACLFIDTTWRDLLRAYGDIATAQDTAAAQTRIQRLFHADCLVAISARTAFDAWLRVRAFPRGSEIVMTAINIPDMIKVMREHGIVPVPVDVCVRTLAPAAAALEALITPKTVAVLVAQIYGRQFPLDAFVDVARRHRLPLIEDLAESYSGPGFTGSPDAHLSLFSFGPIKYNTAFGGGIAVVRDAAVLAQMRALHSSYATRSKTEMLHKLAKYSVVMAFLNVPVLSGCTMRLCRALGVDHKAYVVSLLRGFPDKFFEKLRHQPDPAMLAILERRLREFDAADFALSATNGELLTKTILDAEMRAIGSSASAPVVTVPGLACPVRNYWLFPIIVEDPNRTIKELNDNGIDAYRGATQLALVDAPSEWSGRLPSPPSAKLIMDKTLYLPVHKRTPPQLVKALGETVAKVSRNVNRRPVFAAGSSLPTPPASASSSSASSSTTSTVAAAPAAAHTHAAPSSSDGSAIAWGLPIDASCPSSATASSVSAASPSTTHARAAALTSKANVLSGDAPMSPFARLRASAGQLAMRVRIASSL